MNKSWRHPLAPKLPNSRYHIPAPKPKIAVQLDDAQVAPPMSKESSSTQRGPEHPHPNQTDQLDQDLDLHQNYVPDFSERPVAGHAQCWLTDDMFQQPGLATYLRSAQLSPSRSLGSFSLFCMN